MLSIRYYRRTNGRHPFKDWLMDLADKRARAAVLRRIDRVEERNSASTDFCATASGS